LVSHRVLNGLAGCPALKNTREGESHPPTVVFVCQDQGDVSALMELANNQVTGCLANPGDPPARWR
jgi:hypothetical protein